MQQLVFTQSSLFDFPSIKSIGTLRYCIRFAHLSNCEIYPLRIKTAFRCAPRYAIGTFVQFNKNSKVHISLNLWYHKRCLKYMLKLDLMLRWKVLSSIRIMMKYLCPSQPKILEPAYIVTKNWYELKWSWTKYRKHAPSSLVTGAIICLTRISNYFHRGHFRKWRSLIY